MTRLSEMMIGRLTEDSAVPVPATKQQPSARGRARGREQATRDENEDRRKSAVAQRSTVAAMMGMAESEEGDDREYEEGVIPSSAQEIGDVAGTASVKGVDHEKDEKDKEPKDAVNPTYLNGTNEPLMSPAVALVAPDVTPQALEPLDPSQVPQPKPQEPVISQSRNDVNPMDVLLGRNKRAETTAVEMEQPVTVESVQATINASLGVTESGGNSSIYAPLPEHKPSSGINLMEMALKYRRG